MAAGVRVALALLALGASLPTSAAAMPAGPHPRSAAECHDCLGLTLERAETGWIRARVNASEPVDVVLEEQVGAARRPVANLKGVSSETVVRRAAPWRCDRRRRDFVATATFPDGVTQAVPATIHTPSCARRLLFGERRARGRITVRVADRWKLGDVSVRSCVRAPGHEATCRGLGIPAGRKDVRHSYRARAGGLWDVTLTAPWGQRGERQIYVRPRGRLRLLATGDSMIQIVDSYLKDRLAKHGVGVRSDARISTGLSKPFLLNWPKHAAGQARGIRPDVTVVFIGANDGFPFGGTDCCGDAWVGAYAKRAEAMMRSYERSGHGLVYWLTLPAPRPAQWRPIYPAVNRAIKRAAAATRGAARVLDIAKTFTPGYRFRQSMVWHGRRQTVRQLDGVHLSPAGASIAETLIERAMRRDGVL